MSYRFRGDESPGAAARRVAREQAQKALGELRRENCPAAWHVHQLRKRCKKIRAVARVIRPGFDGYHRNNRYFRDLARDVSEERDAHVLYELVKTVLADDGQDSDEAPILRWHRLRSELADVAAAGRLPELHQSMAHGAVSIESWELCSVSTASVLDGMSKTLDRVHEAHAAVAGGESVERFHELRKRCKYHWYHLRLLRRWLPPELESRIAVFDELSDLLGDAHDASEYLANCRQLPGFIARQASCRSVTARVLERRRRLRRKALRLCESALAMSPDALKSRLTEHWS